MKEISYRLQRCSRRTLVICVKGGEVIVKAPYGVPDVSVQNFVAAKREWIEKKLELQRDPEFEDIRAYNKVLDAGIQKAAVWGSKRNTEDIDTFYFVGLKAVRSYFEKTRCWILLETVHMLAKTVGVCPEKVSVCDFKSRWGSCDITGHIKLNWRLCMLPPTLRDYVLIHELCHRKHMDHSRAFWEEVGKFCPDYRIRRKRLKAYSFLTELYR